MLSVSGMRGIVGASLTPEVIARYTGAVAMWIAREAKSTAPTVIVARDGRASGVMVHRVVVGALVAAGCRVIDLGIATTPTTGVMVLERSADGAIIITASHNPQEWNGLKVLTAQAHAPGAEAAQQIIDAFNASDVQLASHDQLREDEYDDAADLTHVDRVLAAVAQIVRLEELRAKHYRVLVDSVNASGALPARMLLESLGCQETLINDSSKPNMAGVFPHPAEPTEENLRDLAAQASAGGFDVTFAQDPDADRLAILDEQGAYIGEEYTLALCAWAVLDAMDEGARANAVLATNLSTSRMIEDIAAKYGARVERTPVGEANLVQRMRELGSPIGGEGNGGVIWPRVVPIRDSISSMALVLALMTRTGCTISQLVAQMPGYAIVKRKVELRDGMAERALHATQDMFADEPGARVVDIDGVRVDLEAHDGGAMWVHVRPSNTEPILRLIAEAPSADQANALLDRVASAIQ